MLQSNLTSLKAEVQQYTDWACDSVKIELLEEEQTLKGKVRGLKEEVEAQMRLHDVKTLHAEDAVLAGNAGVADSLGSVWGREPRGLAASCRNR